MRYITVPESFTIVDPVEEKPIEGAETFPFAKFIRVLTSNAAGSGPGQQPTADALTLVDIRTEAAKLAAGDTWKVSDEWYQILKSEAVRPRGASAAFVFSAASHIRAIVNAPDKPSAAAS